MHKELIDKSLIEEVTHGGDTRITLTPPHFTNKYHLNPMDYKGVFNRGSCTASLLNPFTENLLHEFGPKSRLEESFEEIKRLQIERLKNLMVDIGDKQEFNIIFTPSGSDNTYLPLLFSKLLYPEKKICTLVAAPEELGTGTIEVTNGLHFMTKSQNGQMYAPKTPIFSNEKVKYIKFQARNADGEIIDHKKSFKKAIAENSSYSRIGFLVVGSKSGIENNLDIISETKDDMLWVVDLCQMRIKRKLISKLLKQNCMIMVTGSKFFQSPPFCGALLVPKKLSEDLENTKISADAITPFKDLFTSYDFPKQLHNIRQHFPDFKNLGLLMRWECGLSEMEQLNLLTRREIEYTIAKWNRVISDRMRTSDYLSPMPNMEKTNKTIISFRGRYRNQYLSSEEMRELFENLVSRRDLNLNGFHRVFIGQPVQYQSNAFLRLAIGSYDIRNLVKSGYNFDNDLKLLDIIEKEIHELKS